MSKKGDDDKIAAIVENVFDLHALVRGARRTGEFLLDDPDIGRLGLEFMAVMTILSQADEQFSELTKELGFDEAA